MGKAAQPNPALRKLLLVLLIVGGALSLWAIYVKATQTIRPPWIELPFALVWAVLGLLLWFFPQDWRSSPLSLRALALLSFALSAFVVITSVFLKG
jgi:peptidoglycan/LPS O-acetylase OafA/YrhL